MNLGNFKWKSGSSRILVEDTDLGVYVDTQGERPAGTLMYYIIVDETLPSKGVLKQAESLCGYATLEKIAEDYISMMKSGDTGKIDGEKEKPDAIALVAELRRCAGLIEEKL